MLGQEIDDKRAYAESLPFRKVVPSATAYHQNYKSLPARLNVTKILVHPGEINSFKTWPMNRRIIASHTDHPEIYIWDGALQPSTHSKIRIEPN